jgi:hypothetical protein
MIQIDALILTKGHPVYLDGCWTKPEAVGVHYPQRSLLSPPALFPVAREAPITQRDEEILEVYNFVLSDARTSIFVNGFQVATLGTRLSLSSVYLTFAY